jgi:hypothetical protein
VPKPFDATLKALIRHHPADWLGLIGVVPASPPEWVDAELSTISASADTVLRVGDQVYHFEFEAGPDDTLADRVLMYNVVAHYRTGLPVRSAAVLLRPNAQRAGLTGEVAYDRLTFEFDIVRVWQRPANEFLRGPLGLLPLTVLGQPPRGQTREQALPEQVDRIIDRAVSEAGERRGEVVTAAFLLAGMHQENTFLRTIFHRGLTMIESSAFQVIEDLAMERKAREWLLKQGTELFGLPTPDQAAKLAAIENLPRLDRLALRVLKVKTWDALLKGR